MGIAETLLLLFLAAVVLVGLGGVGIVILIKLGVIASYATRQEPPDQQDYDLDQSKEAGEK